MKKIFLTILICLNITLFASTIETKDTKEPVEQKTTKEVNLEKSKKAKEVDQKQPTQEEKVKTSVLFSTDKFDAIDVYLLLETHNKFISEMESDNIDNIVQNRKNYTKKIINTIKFNIDLKFNHNKKDITKLFKEIELLQEKIYIQKKYDNKLTLNNDLIKLEILNIKMLLYSFFNDLKYSFDKETFTNKVTEKEVETMINNYISRIGDVKIEKFTPLFEKLSKKENITKLETEIINNYNQLLADINSYSDILTGLNSSKEQMVSNVINYFKVEYLIDKINSYKLSKDVNYYLDIFSIDSGRLSISFLAFVLIFLIRRKVFSLFDFLFKKHKNREALEGRVIFLVRKHFEYLVISFGVYMFFLILLFPNLPETISMLIKVSYTLIISFMLYRITNLLAYEKIHEVAEKFSHIREEIINMIFKAVKTVIFLISLLIILQILGFDISTIIASLGIGGLAIALAAKDSLSNLFASISILLDNSFKQGDWIKTDLVEGTVVEIGIRSTTVRTFDNALVTVPNSKLADTSIMNWNRRKVGRRIKMSLGITYESKKEDLQNAVNEIKEMLLNNPKIANPSKIEKMNNERTNKLISIQGEKGIKNTLLVYLDTFEDSSINILVYAFSKTVNWDEWLEVKEDVMYQIMEIVERNNLEFAYPTQTLFMQNTQKEEIN